MGTSPSLLGAEATEVTDSTDAKGVDLQAAWKTPGSRGGRRPAATVSLRRTRLMKALGGMCIALGLLALLVASPLALMIAWSTSGSFIAGVKASALVAGLGVLMLVANWVVFGLGERTPAERKQSRRERDVYEAANGGNRRTSDAAAASIGAVTVCRTVSSVKLSEKKDLAASA